MSESFDPRRRWLGAITLVLCIGILWALLMPAMRGTSRDPARRTQCKSNLKNLALATINFETVKKQFPGYQSVFGKRDDESAKIGSWVVALLPMLEQQALRDEWDDPTTQESWLAAVRNKDEEMLKVFYPEMNIFNCPSDILEKAKFGATSYAVNAGFHLLPNDPALGFDVYVNAADAAAQSAVSQRAANGVFANRAGPSVIDPQTGKLTSVFGYHSNRISSADVKDGLSSTILCAENCNSLSWQDFSIVDDTSRCKQGIVWLYAGTSASDGRPKPIAVTSDMRINHGNTKSKGGPVRARPSGFHSGIIVLAFTDGSTRSISGDIDYHVYQSLMAPQDSASDIPNQSYVLKEMDYEL
jgi:Protein of unknown function (DUF1559)